MPRKIQIAAVAAWLLAVSTAAADSFTIAVIPDTQNYLDYTHRKVEGFPFDASELFLEQMRYVSGRLQSRGGDIAFVTSVGDVWQSRIDAKGPPPARDQDFGLKPEVARIEAPVARRGYELLAGEVPFSVVPGNHDYDWSWKDGSRVRVGGLVNFNATFGAQSSFFKDQPWYVSSHDGGGDSAQLFSAGGYRFLHLGLQYEPSDASLAWARSVIERYRGLPTIVTTHKFLDASGRRPSDAENSASYNSAQSVWEKLIREHDQIFLVLSGHFNSQAFRVDENRHGRKVYQLLSDYQDRRQSALDAGLTDNPKRGIGDGWLRLMTFDMAQPTPTLRVRTYSTHYGRFSSELPGYLAWYKGTEKPELADAQFLSGDDFQIELTDFRNRFGRGESPARQDAAFEVSFPAAAHSQPITGRLFVMISRVNEPEVRLQSHWFNSPQMIAADVKDLGPGQTAVLDASTPGTPLSGLGDVPPGDYYVQAVLNTYTKFQRADGHVIWAHLDRGEGQQFNRSPGNLHSPVVKLHLDASAGYKHRLSLERVIPPLPPPADTKWVKRIEFQSKLLSEFWGQPIHLGAVILLPRDYATRPDEHYPVVYHLAEHSSAAPPFNFSTEQQPESESRRRARLSAGYETGYEFYRSWQSDDFPRMIAVSLQGPTPFADMSGFVNSANNGPYGDALIQELIPHIEATFRIVREPRQRLLFGQASAGRDALNLQLRYPEFFGGAWLLQPWAFDHRSYFALDIYRNDNAFEVEPDDLPDWARNPSGWLPVERYLARLGDGTPIATFRQLSRHDLVMASHAGGEFGIDDAMMSPVGDDGYPQPLWDRLTGRIDRQVAEHWARHYDLAAYAQRHWSRIGPHLDGKIHMYAGEMDHFWRNDSVRRFETFLRASQDPHVSAEFAYGPRKGHWQPSSNAELVRAMAAHAYGSNR